MYDVNRVALSVESATQGENTMKTEQQAQKPIDTYTIRKLGCTAWDMGVPGHEVRASYAEANAVAGGDHLIIRDSDDEIIEIRDFN